jgi:hypothetical protein
MKKLGIITLALLFSSITWAQSNVVNKYFNELGDDEKYVKVSISSKMFSLFTELEAGSDEEKEFLEAVSKLKGMKIVVGDSVPKDASRLYGQAVKDVENEGFEELMSVVDADENFKFSIKDKNGKIEELIMVAGGKQSFVLLSLYGEIDLKNIAKIAKSMNVEGLSNLGKLNDQ